MKRSYDYSFVQDTDTTTIAPHSFRRRPATLAAHPFYDREDYTLTTAPGHYYQNPEAAPYLLNTYQEPESDFQSNVWHHSLLAAPANWSNDLRLSVPQRRLAGLGITFDSSEPLLNTNQRSTAEISVCDQLASSEATEGEPDPWIEDASCAYSECPSADFVAHSASAQPADYFIYSPTDEFLMLVDSSPLLDRAMDVDSPVGMATHGFSNMPDVSSAFDSPGTEHVGIIPDVNYRTMAVQLSPVACVNPADITGPGPGIIQPKNEEADLMMAIEQATTHYPDSPSLDSMCKAEFPAEAVSAIVSVLAASTQDLTAAPRTRTTPPAIPIVRHRQYITHELVSVQLPAFASRSKGGPITALPPAAMSATRVQRSPLATVQLPMELPPAMIQTQQMMQTKQLSPVLNAHEGVPLEDLRRRVEAFRTLNPGFDLDKTFLQAYAGRLSERGELIPDFRCYVKGCSQSNKRRDHILVHVGSHVEHRPFKCDQW